MATQFQVGDQVMVNKGSGTRQRPYWEGPYEVTSLVKDFGGNFNTDWRESEKPTHVEYRISADKFVPCTACEGLGLIDRGLYKQACPDAVEHTAEQDGLRGHLRLGWRERVVRRSGSVILLTEYQRDVLPAELAGEKAKKEAEEQRKVRYETSFDRFMKVMETGDRKAIAEFICLEGYGTARGDKFAWVNQGPLYEAAKRFLDVEKAKERQEEEHFEALSAAADAAYGTIE